MSNTDGPSAYYADKAREASKYRRLLQAAKDECADAETIARLQWMLELAEYTGD